MWSSLTRCCSPLVPAAGTARHNPQSHEAINSTASIPSPTKGPQEIDKYADKWCQERELKYIEPLPQRPNNEANLKSIAKMRKYRKCQKHRKIMRAELWGAFSIKLHGRAHSWRQLAVSRTRDIYRGTEMMSHYFSFMNNNKNMIQKCKQILLKMMKSWSLKL